MSHADLSTSVTKKGIASSSANPFSSHPQDSETLGRGEIDQILKERNFLESYVSGLRFTLCEANVELTRLFSHESPT